MDTIRQWRMVRGVGQTSGLTVGRASGPESPHSQTHGAGGSVNRQTGGLTHTGTATLEL